MTTTYSQVRQIIGKTRVPSKMGLLEMSGLLVRRIENKKYDGAYPTYIYSAAYGIAHGLLTGRIDGSRAVVFEKLTGKSAAGFIVSIAEKQLMGDDVSRFMNGRPFSQNECGQWHPVY